MIYVLYAIHVIVCIFLILVVLLQQGKGADLSVFGGGSTQAAFGARGATTLLHKLTVISFAIFILTTLLIGIPQARQSTVMSGVASEGTDSGETQLPNPVTNEQGPLTPGKGTQAAPVPVSPAPAAPPTPAPQQPQQQ